MCSSVESVGEIAGMMVCNTGDDVIKRTSGAVSDVRATER